MAMGPNRTLCAGGLAKMAARQLFADRLRDGRLQLRRDPTWTAAKKKTTEERVGIIDRTRAFTPSAARKAKTPLMQLAAFATRCCKRAEGATDQIYKNIHEYKHYDDDHTCT